MPPPIVSHESRHFKERVQPTVSIESRYLDLNYSQPLVVGGGGGIWDGVALLYTCALWVVRIAGYIFPS